jgi:hypothetical protein
MHEMARSAFGRNALTAGLICHLAAILAGMLSASGGDAFFKMVYPVSWMLLTAGGFAELRHRGIVPLKGWRFYLIVLSGVFPVLGPLLVLGLIYSAPGNDSETGNLTGLFSATLKLRANGLLILVLILSLFVLFIILHAGSDSYFQKRYPPGSAGLQTTEENGCRKYQKGIKGRCEIPRHDILETIVQSGGHVRQSRFEIYTGGSYA